jgi:hypothetical protein
MRDHGEPNSRPFDALNREGQPSSCAEQITRLLVFRKRLRERRFGNENNGKCGNKETMGLKVRDRKERW